MRTSALIFALISLSGCATVAPISYQEQCALKGMTLTGVTSETSSTFLAANNGVMASGVGSSEAVSCEVPKTERNACEARRLASSVQPKIDYNATKPAWNFGIGAGYLLYVLPGIGMKVWADKTQAEAVAQSQRLEQESRHACEAGPLPAPEIRKPAAK